jgi:opacity protein-like surface antigen
MKHGTRFEIALIVSLVALILGVGSAFAQTPVIQVIPHVEEGVLGVLYHHYQVGDGGTDFNFITQGGQDILFPYQRYSVDVVLYGKHRLTFLYQPLTITTSSVVDRNGSGTGDLVVDGTVFAPGTPLDLKYGFDFWRLSYLYDFSNDPATILGLGASLQIRDASIVFSAADGSARTASQNVGPVPVLKTRLAHWFSPAVGVDFEADGFYASSAFFNGSAKPFTGWVWDAALSLKARFGSSVEAFLTARSIGGGAQGNGAYSYVSATTTSTGAPTLNVLATAAVTLGASIGL